MRLTAIILGFYSSPSVSTKEHFRTLVIDALVDFVVSRDLQRPTDITRLDMLVIAAINIIEGECARFAIYEFNCQKREFDMRYGELWPINSIDFHYHETQRSLNEARNSANYKSIARRL